MIKINLLPAYVVEGRKVKSLLRLLIVVVLLEIVGLSFFVYSLAQQERKKEVELTEVTEVADKVRKLDQDIEKEKKAMAPVAAKIAWYGSVHAHNKSIATALEKIDDYIFEKLTVRRMTVTGNRVQLQGATKDLDHVAQAYLNLLRNKYMMPNSLTMNLSVRSGSTAGGASRGGAGGRGGGRMGAGGPRMGGGGGGAAGGGGAQARSKGKNDAEAMAVSFTYTLLPADAIGSPPNLAGARAGSGAGSGAGGRGAGGRASGRFGRGR